MYCPEHLVFKSRFVWVWMYWRDVPRSTIPLSVWINPLNYEVSIHLLGRRVSINKNGQWLRMVMWKAKEKARSFIFAASKGEKP